MSPDELMAAGKTDSRGHFEIKGHAEEFTSIEPKLNIYHDCDDGIMVSCTEQIRPLYRVLYEILKKQLETSLIVFFP